MSINVEKKASGSISAPSAGSSVIFINLDGQLAVKQTDGSSGSVPVVSSSNTQVIFNDAGNLAGSSNLVFNTSTNVLTASGNINASYFIGNGSQLTGLTAGLTITDETSSSSIFYPAFTSNTSGTISAANVSSTKLYFVPSTGQLNATSFNSLSDKNFKTNMLVIENALTAITSLNGYSFEYIDGSGSSYGVSAQEVELVMPNAVSTDPTGRKSVNYNSFTAYLIEAVKDLSNQITELKKELNNRK